jgi:hypothetical protein
LLGITAILLYRSVDVPYSSAAALAVGLVITPALVFGHQFSAGAAMIFLFVVGVFAVATRWLAPERYGITSSGERVFLFVTTYLLAVMGNPVHQGPLLGRFSDLLLSVVQSTETGSASGGPGRYSELALDVLIASTAAQTLLFALAVLGAVWLFRRSEWEYDLTICWMGAISVLLVVSLLVNSVDTAPQRFYGLLVLFGFNVCVGTLFHVLDRRGVFEGGSVTINGGRIAVVLLVTIFAMTSLVSPVADKATSPVGDDVPHFRQFDTNQRIQGDQWSEQYGEEVVQLTTPNTEIPIEQTSATTGEANISGLESGTLLSYSDLVNRTGMISSTGLTLGGRQFVFVESPARPTDSRVYTNGETTTYILS